MKRIARFYEWVMSKNNCREKPMLKVSNSLTAEEIVAALYRQILGRESDAGGFAAHVHSLKTWTHTEAMDDLIGGFIKSDEARTKFYREVLSHLAEITNAKLVSYPVIQHVVSLGTACYTSQVLKNFNLKRYSCPFDWLFSSSRMIAHCIKDDFKTLLDAQYYEPVPVEKRSDGEGVNRVNHTFYREHFDVHHVFNHHDVHQENDYQYLVRCVDRLRNCLNSQEGKLFVMCCREELTTERDFMELSRVIRDKTDNAVLFVFAVADRSQGAMPIVEEVNKFEQNVLFRVHPVSEWKPLKFADVLDDIAIIRTVRQLDIQLANIM